MTINGLSFYFLLITLFSIDELLEKQRKKRLREREKYSNSISSKKSKKSQKNNKFGDEHEIVPALPMLPVINNVSHYAGEKTDASWLYHQSLQRQKSDYNYYDSQPMTLLESSYSLQRDPSQYSPYNEVPYHSQNPIIYQPTDAYTIHQDASNVNYHSTPQQQYSNNITSPPDSTKIAYNKPHTYSTVIDKSTFSSNAVLATYYESSPDSHFENNTKASNPETAEDSYLPNASGYNRNDMHNDTYNNSNASQFCYNDNQPEVIKKPAINPQTYANYL